MKSTKAVAVVGAGIALIFFLWVALLPSMMFGGYAGTLLAGGIFGTPVPPTLLARGLVVFGMVLGVISVASAYAIAGALLSSVAWEIVLRVTPEVPEPRTEASPKPDSRS